MGILTKLLAYLAGVLSVTVLLFLILDPRTLLYPFDIAWFAGTVLKFSLPGYVVLRLIAWAMKRETFPVAIFFGALNGLVGVSLMQGPKIIADPSRIAFPLFLALGAVGGAVVLMSERKVSTLMTRAHRGADPA